MAVAFAIATIAAIAFIGTLAMLIIRIIKRKPKKLWFISLGASFGLFIAGAVIGGASTDKPVATSDISGITSFTPTPTVTPKLTPTLKPTPKMTLAQEFVWVEKEKGKLFKESPPRFDDELEIRYKRLRMLAESLAPNGELESIDRLTRTIDFNNKKQVDFFLRMGKAREDLLVRVLEANPNANLPSDDALYDWGIKELDQGLVTSMLRKLKPSESPEEYKQSARSDLSYGELLRNTKQYEGQRVTYQGEVVQVANKAYLEPDTFLMALRVHVTAKEYGFGDDIVWAKGVSKTVLEHDIVRFWGVVDGKKTYKSVSGNEITIPEITARYLEIVKARP